MWQCCNKHVIPITGDGAIDDIMRAYQWLLWKEGLFYAHLLYFFDYTESDVWHIDANKCVPFLFVFLYNVTHIQNLKCYC